MEVEEAEVEEAEVEEAEEVEAEEGCWSRGACCCCCCCCCSGSIQCAAKSAHGEDQSKYQQEDCSTGLCAVVAVACAACGWWS